MADDEYSATVPAINDSCPNISVYLCYDKGMLMPFVSEYTWPKEARGTIYFLGLIWSFLGVAIIADLFMCSIEKITSKTRTIKVANQETEKGYEEIEVKVWNDTVANLTLMALGSSAPEILLSLIEICGNGFEAGALGPSTIVGSASFNLLVITGVCVIAIPGPDFRRIKHIKVFAVTAVFSIFAYVWLIVILVLVTPNYVDLWEAIITLLFFPILVILAYVADKDFCSKKASTEDGNMELGFGKYHFVITCIYQSPFDCSSPKKGSTCVWSTYTYNIPCLFHIIIMEYMIQTTYRSYIRGRFLIAVTVWLPFVSPITALLAYDGMQEIVCSDFWNPSLFPLMFHSKLRYTCSVKSHLFTRGN